MTMIDGLSSHLNCVLSEYTYWSDGNIDNLNKSFSKLHLRLLGIVNLNVKELHRGLIISYKTNRFISIVPGDGCLKGHCNGKLYMSRALNCRNDFVPHV